MVGPDLFTESSGCAESALDSWLPRENSPVSRKQAGEEGNVMWSDPIADMLTRIRNANAAFKESVDIPASNLKKKLLDILKAEGYIDDYKYIEDGKQGVLKVFLKYKGDRRNKVNVITGIVRISKPGRRIYVNRDKLPKVKSGMGIAIVSTSSGVMTDKQARMKGVGGEVICYVW